MTEAGPVCPQAAHRWLSQPPAERWSSGEVEAFVEVTQPTFFSQLGSTHGDLPSTLPIRPGFLSCGKTKPPDLNEGPAADSMIIFVQIPSGEVLEVEVFPSTLVAALKENVAELVGGAADELRLIYEGKQLFDGQPMQAYGVSHGSLMRLVMKLASTKPSHILKAQRGLMMIPGAHAWQPDGRRQKSDATSAMLRLPAHTEQVASDNVPNTRSSRRSVLHKGCGDSNFRKLRAAMSCGFRPQL